MSGSGGGGFNGQYAVDDLEIACEKLAFTTQLSSPQESVVGNLRVGEVLSVAIRNFGGGTIVAVLFHDDVAGGIASPQTARLRECMQQGANYIATVLSVNGGQVRIQVQPDNV